MRSKNLFLLILCFLFGMYSEISAQGKHPSHGLQRIDIAGETISVIPKPHRITHLQGVFTLSQKTVISTDENCVELGKYAQELLSPATGFLMPLEQVSDRKPTRPHSISLRLEPQMDNYGAEGYALSVKKDGISIHASTPAGVLYGIQTLRQLLPAKIESSKPVENVAWEIPCVEIKDKPRFPWRGLMLDCSRTFWSKDYIKRTIRLMSFYKLNRLHLHLTDDQGWRLEIKKYPKLTSIGSKFSDKYKEPSERQGFYSQTDIKEIVEYGNLHNVTIVPEIEMPGHTLAALACYPDLSCSGGPFEIHPYGKGPGNHKDIFCAGNEKTFQFLEDVLSEVIELFPSSVIHIGGDEAPKHRWKACPKCQKRMKDQGLSTEFELQKYFINRVETFLSDHGRILVGWDEILESHAAGIGHEVEVSYDEAGGALALSESAVVMSWRGTQGGIAASKAGHDVVMSPTSHCYFDYNYSMISTMKAYAFEPVPKQLSKTEAKHILGAQANFWSHIDRTEDKVDKQLFPRLLSIAEVTWSSKERDESCFRDRVRIHLPRLKELGVKYYQDPSVTNHYPGQSPGIKAPQPKAKK